MFEYCDSATSFNFSLQKRHVNLVCFYVKFQCSPVSFVDLFLKKKKNLFHIKCIYHVKQYVSLYEQCTVCIVWNSLLSAYDFTFSASALHLSLWPLHVYRLYTTYGSKRWKLYVLLVLASVPYMSLFVYDTVCIGSPGTTSASGSTSACGRVTARVKIRLQVRIKAKVTSPTQTRREASPGGGFPAGPAQK